MKYNAPKNITPEEDVKKVERKLISDEKKIDDHTLYMKGIDASYYYEGYTLYKTGELEE